MSHMSHVYDPNKHTPYYPVNEEKYTGKDLPIARSTWETKFMQWCDVNPSIIKWSSESIAIPYYDHIKRKNRRYFPDFTMSVKDINGQIQNYIIEIKPYKETIPPTKHGNKKDKTFMYEFTTYQTNVAKWKAASIFCRKYGLIFRILTEKDLFKEGKG